MYNDKYNLNIIHSQIGVIGENIKVEGGIHFYSSQKTIPLEYPPKPVKFINRELEMIKLLNDLQPCCVITLCGIGGIGKSALASKAIWEIAPDNKPSEKFPDGILWYDFCADPHVQHALEHIALSCGEVPKPTPVSAAKRALSNKCMLVLLDSTENADNLPLLLNILGTCCVIITTRKKSDAIEERFDITSLKQDESVELLYAWAGVKNNANDANKICEFLGGLPLSIRLVGRYLSETGENISHYLSWLESKPFKALDQGKLELESVSLLFEKSFKRLSGDALEILYITGGLAFASFNRSLIEEVLSKKNIKERLNELINYGLLMKSEGRYIISHSLIYKYIKMNHRPDSERFYKIVNYYKNFIEETKNRKFEGYKKLNKELIHILNIIDNCKRSKKYQDVKDFTWIIYQYLEESGYWEECLKILELGVDAAKNTDDKYAEGAFINNIASVLTFSGKNAILAIEKNKQALKIFQDLNDKRNQSATLNNIARSYQYQGKIDKAIDHYNRALNIDREIKCLEGESLRLGNIGSSYYLLGKMGKAIEYNKEALLIDNVLGNKELKNSHLQQLFHIYETLGLFNESITYCKESLKIYRELCNQKEECECLLYLGSAYNKLSLFDRSISYYQESIIISKKVGYQKGEISGLTLISISYLGLNQPKKAIKYLQDAIVLINKIGEQINDPKMFNNLGRAHVMIKQPQKALKYYTHALNISKKLGNIFEECVNLRDLGSTFHTLGQAEKAIDYFEQALNISRINDFNILECNCLYKIGLVQKLLGHIEKSVEYHEQSLFISKEIGSQHFIGHNLWALGDIYKSLEQIEKAILYYKDALNIYKKIEYKTNIYIILNNLGNIYNKFNSIEKAILFYKDALIISREIADKEKESVQLGNLAIMNHKLGKLFEAMQFYDESLVVNREIGNQEEEGAALGNLANIFYVSGDIENAIKFYTDALSIYEEIKSPLADITRKQLKAINYVSNKPIWLKTISYLITKFMK